MKIFVPGPVYVRPEILQEMARPMVFSHRSKEFSQLLNEATPKLQKLLYTNNNVFISTSSGSGLMEAAVRNCVRKKCLNLVCGAFSDRWRQMISECEKESNAIEVEWGKGIHPEMVREELERNGSEYDALCLTHNETSTGVMNPLKEIADIMRDYPEITFMVDTVSSMAGVKIEVDKLGIDICLASVQKCFGLPPGISVFSVSQKALDKSKTIPGRGHYFDLQAFLKYYEKGQTISTPSISHLYALNKQLDFILEEGLDNRFGRHEAMAKMTRKWAIDNFEMYPEKGFESLTLSVIKNTRNLDIGEINKQLKIKGKAIADGYGKIKGQTFRIAHMADLQIADVKELLDDLNGIMGLK
ncbi:alanine--glyoxylate aminotransferase family protein [Candidatus Woesearchaeota archaeon]|nr:alanine--glyoxylate aminotransferase family protein [Candidatus Woesearchaeota archaeon]